MLFNSLDFAVFFPLFFLGYWLVSKLGILWQNLFIVAGSYFFYGWWDWQFLALIAASTSVDFIIGRELSWSSDNGRRKRLLWISVLFNIGLLAVFKYFNFFIDSFNEAFKLFGSTVEMSSLQLILPIGISFYTFQTMSYTIDIYRQKMKPTSDFVAFAAFVSFFPQLVAGPIERAQHFLPQFFRERSFNYERAVDGCRQILWGLIKKIVIADSCAVYVNMIFDQSADLSGSILLLGAFLFAFQIYGDFSGYSDMAIGFGRLLGFDLRQNFAYPYFARSVAEFWRRWHISLSTWFRDYVYIPLGGSRGSTSILARNILIVFVVSGFWHGAKWTFIFWGLAHALFILPSILSGRHRTDKAIPQDRIRIMDVFRMGTTFVSVTLAWVLFRADNLNHAFAYFKGIFTASLFTVSSFQQKSGAFVTCLLIVGFMVVEWRGRHQLYAVEGLVSLSPVLRWGVYILLIFILGMFGQTGGSPFIYFQF